MKKISYLILVMFFALDLSAQELPKDSDLAANGWRELLFDNKVPNHFATTEDGAIEVGTQESVSLLYKDIDIDLTNTPRLAWSWKVEKNVPVTDLSVKGEDDRSLALYVSFPFDEENASFWERFTRSLVVAVKGEDAPGRVISYVWGDDAERGTILESPYLKSAGALIVLQKAETVSADWIMESVDVAADYERIFGVRANKPYQIAISADSDDTKGESLGWVKDIQFQ